MKKARYIIVFLIIIGIFATTIHFQAVNEFENIMASIANTDKLQIALKDYSSGCKVDLADAVTIEEIRKNISEIQYDGIFWAENFIMPTDKAYSLIVFSRSFHIVFTISASHEKSRVIGSSFSISIKNYDSLYKTVKAVFG